MPTGTTTCVMNARRISVSTNKMLIVSFCFSRRLNIIKLNVYIVFSSFSPTRVPRVPHIPPGTACPFKCRVHLSIVSSELQFLATRVNNDVHMESFSFSRIAALRSRSDSDPCEVRNAED